MKTAWKLKITYSQQKPKGTTVIYPHPVTREHVLKHESKSFPFAKVEINEIQKD